MIVATMLLVSTTALSALQKAMDSDAEWTMARQLPGASRTLEIIERDVQKLPDGEGNRLDREGAVRVVR